MELSRIAVEAIWLILTIVALPLGVGFIVALLVGAFQAATQIQDGSLSFLPRLAAVCTTVALAANWAGGEIARFTTQLWAQFP